MGKNIIILMLGMLMFGQINGKPYKTVKVYKGKPVHAHYGKPVYVKVHPERSNVVFVKPVCPGPQHIWIDGDWIWSPETNQYIYVEGKWIVPVSNSVWIPGHWKKTRYGWYWIKGHWR